MKSKLYTQELQGITKAYAKRSQWDDVISSGFFNSDDDISMEAFIDFVEATYKMKVKDAKHLQDLTGLNEKAFKLEPGIEPGDEATFERIIFMARYSRYIESMRIMLMAGDSYTDLTKLDPESFGLPKEWPNYAYTTNQYTTILMAINSVFSIDGLNLIKRSPNLRIIADEIKAPYSVMMDCHKLVNQGRSPK